MCPAVNEIQNSVIQHFILLHKKAGHAEYNII